MGFLNPWYLLFLLLVPVILLLYLLKQKAEERSFSSLLLWREAFENTRATTPWEKLRRNLLMLLQILIVALLALSLAAPYVNWGASGHTKAILVVDTSASMNALYDGGQTRMDKALEEARDYISSMGTGMEVTIVSMDQKAAILAANLTDKAEAMRVLSSLEAADLAGNPGPAIGTVSSLLKQEGDQEVVFFTDEPLDLSALENARIVDVSSVGANACVDYVSSGLQDGRLVVMTQISNPSPVAFRSDINLYLDDGLAGIQEVDLAPGESKILYFEGLDPGGAVLKAEINEKDLLAGDNSAYALLNAQTESRVLLITAGNVFLEKSISLVEGVELYKAAELVDLSAAEFDLYLFDGVVPNALPTGGNCIFINPPAQLEGIIPAGQPLEQVSVAAAPTPVTNHLEDFRFGVAKATGVTPPPWAKSFFMAGDLSVGYYGGYEGRMLGVIGFDLHDSDFALRTEFPIFIHNLVTQCITRGLLYDHRYSTGDTLTLRPGLTDASLTIVNPRMESETLPPSQESRAFRNLNYAGLWRITDHEEIDLPFLVQFPVVSESPVRSPEAQAPGGGAYAPGVFAAARGRELRDSLVVAGLILLLLEWAVYLRKSTRLS